MRSTGRLVLHAARYLCCFAAWGLAAQGQELSHARIVRLSFAEGVVSVHRPDAGAWATASVNTPIQEGFKVATDQAGFAEIEFENASTARIGQQTLLEFTQLALLPSGGKVNRMTLHQGYATFNVIPESDDMYEVVAGGATLTAQEKTRFRVDLDGGNLLVKVFKGSVEIMSPEGTGTLGKNTVLEIHPGGEQPFEISQGLKKDDWDEWVEDREERTEMVRNMGARKVFPGYSNNTNDLLWGAMDLMYYGTWFSDPIYGYGWAPTAGPGWSPYTHGRWSWYPGWGYTWIGMEPWGWLPYHYGSWNYNAGIGWCWFPTGGFQTWSPARVSWYQGNGWVGWSPRSPVAGGFDNQCSRAEGCVAVAPDTHLTGGRVIQPGDLRWGRPFDLGRPIEQVALEPGRAAMLPGPAQEMSRSFGRGGDPVVREAGISVIGGESSQRPSSGAPGLVYDPATRSYVNNSAVSNSQGVSRDFSREGSIGGARPGPANNYPVYPAQGWGRQNGAAPRGDAGARGSNSDNGDWIRSNAVGWGNTGQSTGTTGASQSTSSGKSDSGSRASSGSSSSGSSSSGRSGGGGSSGWGGGGSSGGGRSSSGSSSSGGWGGGGSSGGGRSSGGGGGGFGGGGGGGGRSSGGGGGGFGGGGGAGASGGGGRTTR